MSFVNEKFSLGGFATESFFLGEEALAHFVENIRSYQALVTDVRLCGEMDGWTAARIVRERKPKPEFLIVYMTAATERL